MDKEDQEIELQRTAHHEAGHFVASYILTPSSYRGAVTIRADQKARTLGTCRSEAPWSAGDHKDEVVGYFAGYVAEKRYDPTASPDGAWSDDEKAREILVLLGEEALEGEYRARADTFVANHWAAIEALAEELLKQDEIRGSEEAEIIIDIARGEATAADLETYRRVCRPNY